MQPWFIASFFDIGRPCYCQLTPIESRYPLTSITWPYRGLKFRAHRGHVFFKLTTDRVRVRLTFCKRGRVIQKSVNANPGLKVNRSINISCIQWFSLLLFCLSWDYSNSQQKVKQYTENLTTKLQTSNQNCRVTWAFLIGLCTTRPGSSAFRLG